MSIGCIGDVHIGGARTVLSSMSARSALRMQQKSILAALTALHEAGAEDIVWLGDVFDNPSPSQEAVVALLDVLSERRFKRMRHTFLTGNHDAHGDVKAGASHALKVVRWIGRRRHLSVTVITEPTVQTMDGMEVFMCPWPWVIDMPVKCSYAFGHFAWAGARRDNGSVAANGQSPAGRWILGDFHTAQSGPRYTYAGSVAATSFGEADSSLTKRVLVIKNGKCRSLPIQPVYGCKTATISDEQQLSKFLAAYRRKEISGARVFWSLKVEGGYVLPPNVLAACRRVASVGGGVKRADAAVAYSLTQLATELDPLGGLRDFLTGEGLRPDLIEEGVALIQRYADGLD